MTSYHDLEESTYQSVITEVITRIHGLPSWRNKEHLLMVKDELTKVATATTRSSKAARPK